MLATKFQLIICTKSNHNSNTQLLTVEVLRTGISVINVVSMLPNIAAKKRLHSIYNYNASKKLPRKGLAALEVQTISREPSAFLTSQDQPEPKKATVLAANSSMKPSTEPHLA